MLEVTQNARDELHRALTSKGTRHREGKCFRLVPKHSNVVTLKFTEPAPSDKVFTHAGAAILALPESLEPMFQDKSLDIDDNGKLTLS